MEVLQTDKVFFDSPDTGQKNCFCSRCGELIPEDEPAIRVWPEDLHNQLIQYEYRYHINCIYGNKINLEQIDG